jgi:hypothetical protein
VKLPPMVSAVPRSPAPGAGHADPPGGVAAQIAYDALEDAHRNSRRLFVDRMSSDQNCAHPNSFWARQNGTRDYWCCPLKNNPQNNIMSAYITGSSGCDVVKFTTSRP